MRKLVKLFLAVTSIVILNACSKSHNPDYVKIGSSTGDFGFQSILGETDSDDYDRVIGIRGFTLAYSDKTTRIDSFTVSINGVNIPDTTHSNELNYVPNKKYSFKIHSSLGQASGNVTAPSISKIQLVDLPDTQYVDQPFKISWKYPAGESNNGAIIVDGFGNNSGLLPPSTTSYTIPSEDLSDGYGRNQIQIISVRYVKFPKLIKPTDNQVRFIEGLDSKAGSYFGVVIGINRYVELAKSK